MLSEKISPKGLTALYKGIRESLPRVLLQPLLTNGADITYETKNGRNAFHYAAKQERSELVVMLIEHLSLNSELIQEAQYAALTLREKEEGKTPLEFAEQTNIESAKAISEYLKYLLENKKQP
jgi:ankyrin repeat protein